VRLHRCNVLFTLKMSSYPLVPTAVYYRISTRAGVASIAVGKTFMMARKTDGSVYSWGYHRGQPYPRTFGTVTADAVAAFGDCAVALRINKGPSTGTGSAGGNSGATGGSGGAAPTAPVPLPSPPSAAAQGPSLPVASSSPPLTTPQSTPQVGYLAPSPSGAPLPEPRTDAAKSPASSSAATTAQPPVPQQQQQLLLDMAMPSSASVLETTAGRESSGGKGGGVPTGQTSTGSEDTSPGVIVAAVLVPVALIAGAAALLLRRWRADGHSTAVADILSPTSAMPMAAQGVGERAAVANGSALAAAAESSTDAPLAVEPEAGVATNSHGVRPQHWLWGCELPNSGQLLQPGFLPPILNHPGLDEDGKPLPAIAELHR
jgi:hypothetical protein